MERDMHNFWETRWQGSTPDDYRAYLAPYYQRQDPIIDLFRQHNIRHVCDAACGFGAYSLMLASAGFTVEGFDIAPTSVGITRTLLASYGVDVSGFKTASVLDTGYDPLFDAVTARSVLDHMTAQDAQSGLTELLRIVKPGGIVVISFDSMDDEDWELPHTMTADGSILYTEGKRKGMVFHLYSDADLHAWLNAYPILLSDTNNRGERFFAIQKPLRP